VEEGLVFHKIQNSYMNFDWCMCSTSSQL